MATKVFISWSGELSRKLGGALRDWLPAALQYVKPYFSPEDIEKGTKWNTEIAKELETSNVGVICLTQDNTEKPWILFEAGALSKSIDKSRVCTLLFGLEPTDIKGPLTSFQGTRFNKDDFKRLVITINNNAGDAKLDGAILDNVYTMWWPKLEAQVTELIKTHVKGEKKERRSERDLLEEILTLTRMNVAFSDRPSRSITDRTITNLVECYQRLLLAVEDKDPKIGFLIQRRLGRDLSRLCSEAGLSESLGSNGKLSGVPKNMFADVALFAQEPTTSSEGRS